MKKTLKIIGIILLILIVLIIIAFPFLKKAFMDVFITEMKNQQIEKQYDLEISTSERIPLNIAQFEDSIAVLTDQRYLEMESMLKNANISTIHQHYQTQDFTCEELVMYYLKRIQQYDVNRLNSILELNPDVLTQAREADAAGYSGKLGGIPVVLKANIATADKMATHAGAAVLADYYAKEDAFLVSKLREEGAILLGKTNLSEWAYYMSPNAPSGYSAIGGQTHNPYGKFDVGGSSSGAAAAIAADFAAISIGTKTAGSIIYPSAQNSVLGIRPTTGLVSRTGIIPITMAMDTAGVIAHDAEDIALTLDVISGKDSKDRMTFDTLQNIQNGLESFNPKAASVVMITHGMTKQEEKEFNHIADELTDFGIEVKTEKISYKDLSDIQINRALQAGFQFDLQQFLDEAQYLKVKSLRDIIEFNNADLENRAPFGQELLVESMNNPMSRTEWQSLVDNNIRYSREILDKRFEKGNLIVSFKNSLSAVYSAAGYPALSVPFGYAENGEPMGMTLIAKPQEEEKLLSFAKWYSESTSHHKKPNL